MTQFDPFHVGDSQAAMGFARTAAAHVEREVNKAPLAEIQYPGLVPIDNSAHPFAKTVEFMSGTGFGRAKWINGNSDDIPLAGSELEKLQSDIYTGGVGYGWGWEELGQAMYLGYPLQSEDAMYARRAYEEFIDRLVFEGDTLKNLSGLMNNPNIAVSAPVYGTWMTAATEDHILEDINQALIAIGAQTNYAVVANTILLPHAHWTILATRRLGDTPQTLLNFLMNNNAYTTVTGQPLVIRPVRGLETAGAGGVPRMVVYRRDPQVLKMHIPMPHRFLPVYQDGPLNWVVPGVFRVGGLDIRRPLEFSYVDGI